jgi:hypothetical protein
MRDQARHHGPRWRRVGQKKSHPKPAFLSQRRGCDHATFSAVLFLRRKAMKPTPMKPMIIIAQVEGSGTAEILTGLNIAKTS